MKLKNIRDMEVKDLPIIVGIHRQAFHGFFLDQMGPAFLRSYYRAVLAFPQAIALVCESQPNEIEGFAVGFFDAKEFYAHFKKLRLRLIPTMILVILKKPSLLKAILNNMRRINSSFECDKTAVELSSIATNNLGKGVGSALFTAFRDRAFKNGATAINLTTDDLNNNSVKQFYERHGFVETGVEQRGTRSLRHYRLINSQQ